MLQEPNHAKPEAISVSQESNVCHNNRVVSQASVAVTQETLSATRTDILRQESIVRINYQGSSSVSLESFCTEARLVHKN